MAKVYIPEDQDVGHYLSQNLFDIPGIAHADDDHVQGVLTRRAAAWAADEPDLDQQAPAIVERTGRDARGA